MSQKTKVKKIYIIMYLLLTVFIVLSLIYIINVFLSKKEAKEQSNLLNKIKIYEEESNEENSQNNTKNQLQELYLKNNEETVSIEDTEENEQNKRILQVKQLQEQNSDIIGWLEIENTSINYPVLQGSDNNYYMTHNYNKEKTRNGSIFLNADYDWNIASNNFLIYGHNLGNGTMFQELLKYEDESYYKEHPIIRFTTDSEDGRYEIISVFKSRVYYKSEKNVFRYYYFINCKTQQEYNEFVENAKKSSLYSIDKKANYGDQLITLSTCSYYTEDGRFVVVGRKIKN